MMASVSLPLRVLALTLCVALPSWAGGDEDDLAPLTPVKKAPAKPPPAKKLPPPPPPVVKKAPAVKRPVVEDDLAPLTPVVSRAEVTVKVVNTVANAMLFIDGREVGALPLPAQTLTAGEHTISVRRPGFAPFTKKVVVANRPLPIDAKLTPIAAVLTVTCDVPEAQVFLNGKLLGVAPLKDREVAAGTVEVTVKDGAREEKQKLTLVAGHDYPVAVRFNPVVEVARAPVVSDRPVETSLTPTTPLEPSPLEVTAPAPSTPVYQRWYFWAAIGAVVVAAGVGTAVGVSAAQPPRKRTAPEICMAGPCDGCIGLSCTGAAALMGDSPMKF